MAEPLKVILVVAAVCSGLYAVIFVKNAVLTGEVNPVYILQILISFAGIMGVGLLIWGLVALFQSASRKSGENRHRARRSHV